MIDLVWARRGTEIREKHESEGPLLQTQNRVESKWNGRNRSRLRVNMRNGSIRVPEGKVFYREWSNFEVERSLRMGEQRCELQKFFWLGQDGISGTVPDVKNVHGLFAFIQRVDDSVRVWILTKKQMAKLPVLRNDRTPSAKSLKTMNSFCQSVEPRERTFGRANFDEFVNGFHISKGAIRRPDEVLHGCAGIFPTLCAPDAHGSVSGRPCLDGCLPAHPLARRY